MGRTPEASMAENRIYIDEHYIAGLSDTFGAKLHRHPLIELYASAAGVGHVATGAERVEGQVIVVGPDVVHAIADAGTPGIAIFVDGLTEFGYPLAAYALRGNGIRVFESERLGPCLRAIAESPSEADVKRICEAVLDAVQAPMVRRPFGEAVCEVISLLDSSDAEFAMGALANRVCLSKSRLAHVFSEQTGITLKEYIQYKRLERACRKMVGGQSITQAAYDTGFSGSSHIATSSMKLTGMQLRKLLSL
ncbi:helix-turn-helix domain-containing protein [Slackia heliotrinireducens]|uniref:helix-turn-helix domain-containing protein n=1 Tax=Slackia heliotrinireducens TaxID=84110 RepID=UPI003314A086